MSLGQYRKEIGMMNLEKLIKARDFYQRFS